MATNGNLNFANVNKVTFEGVGGASNAVIDTTTGKIGVGVDSPDANLHVLGNCFVSTNLELGGTLVMGTVNVEAQHALSAITATGNTTPHTVEFQNAETGLVTTGNVSVGKDLTVTGNVAVDTDTLFVDTVNDRVGIGTTSPTSLLHIYKDDTTAADASTLSTLHGIFSGSDATGGGNVNNTGLLINLDSSATGGTATNTEEHRLWGIDVDIDVTGDSDDIKGGKFVVRSSMTENGTDKNTNIYGIDAQGQHNGSGLNTNIIGVGARALKSSDSTNLTDKMIGLSAEYEVNAGTCTDAYGVRCTADRNGGAVTNSYLFYGAHAGNATTITNDYGLYVTGTDKHYLEGNVGIGTADPKVALHVRATYGRLAIADASEDDCDTNTFNAGLFFVDNTWTGSVAHSGNPANGMGFYIAHNSSNSKNVSMRNMCGSLSFGTRDVGSAMSIDDDGNVGIGYSSPDSKLDLRNSEIYNGETSSDFNPGTMGLLQFWAANTTATRWNITVHENNDLYFLCRTSGSGAGSWHQIGYLKDNTNVAQITFTGQHRSFIDGVSYVNYDSLEGLIVSANKNKYYDVDENITTGLNAIRISQSLPLVSLSCRERDKACFGVISGSEDPDSREYVQGSYVSVIRKQKGDTRAFINSVGEGAIWVTNINGSLESGDYITTSNVAGYGQKQDSDSLKNYTVAKITMDCDFDPVTQPVQIIKKDETGENTLDEHGQIQWEDDPSGATEKAYKIRYLDADGNITDEANAVHTAAFVGCTYHCG